MKSEEPVGRVAIFSPALPKMDSLRLKSGLINQNPINPARPDCSRLLMTARDPADGWKSPRNVAGCPWAYCKLIENSCKFMKKIGRFFGKNKSLGFDILFVISTRLTDFIRWLQSMPGLNLIQLVLKDNLVVSLLLSSIVVTLLQTLGALKSSKYSQPSLLFTNSGSVQPLRSGWPFLVVRILSLNWFGK